MRKIAKTFVLAGMLSLTLGLAACGGGSGESDGPSGGDPEVTFRLNYKKNSEEDVFKKVTVKKGECVEEPEEEPEREGFIFDGWHDDQDKDSEFDFEEPISKNTKIFAHWLARLTCTFDLNYSGAPAPTTQEVIQKEAAKRPEDPTRDGYSFVGWVVDKETQKEFFDFTRPFSEDVTLYAKWGTQGSAKAYRFEAEYCDVITKGMGLGGATYSGGQRGKGLIQENDENGQLKASNGYFVHFLYVEGCTLTFEINADAAGTAKIDMRLSAEYKESFKINSTGSNGASKYTIKVNDQSIDYGTIEFTNVPKQGEGWKEFADYPLTASVELKQGKNVIDMVTDNADLLYGTAQATAPMIDCLTIETAQTLTWANAKGSQIL
ncbi:MAG: InlB B-repeat-containing protein [Bacilli bacterium]|nr:InlB B-repeat-containing protein [Bacilli bacterium]